MKQSGRTRLYIRKYWQLYALLVLPVLYFLLFKILPMAGNIRL